MDIDKNKTIAVLGEKNYLNAHYLGQIYVGHNTL